MEHEAETGSMYGVHGRINFWSRVPQCISNMHNNCIGDYAGLYKRYGKLGKRQRAIKVEAVGLKP